MENLTEAKLLRIFISSTDKFKHAPLYEVIVFAAKRFGLAGATVLKGFMGFGENSAISSMKFFAISNKVPLVIELVDEAEKIEKFTEILLQYFDKVKTGGMVTVEKANIILHKP